MNCTCNNGFNPNCQWTGHNEPYYYVTYEKGKIIWGIGNTKQDSKKDAIDNIMKFHQVSPEKCIEDYTVLFSNKSKNIIKLIAQKELIKSKKLKTANCSKKLYDYAKQNGTEDFDQWKIQDGLATLQYELKTGQIK